ncbi:MAG: MFS transporter [Rhodococcus sp. (in: high G+C Gram-positive bacteria)]|nr:MAG: MFS transporter [Rhodococcus sp. (in: high G+C Gram-positive bacteria)]
MNKSIGAQSATDPVDPVHTSALRKITRRVMPILVLGYFISYLDRINISFAKFGLEESFGMSATAYGFAAGIFFLGYILFEVPSSIMMRRYGARFWLTRIMVTWGLVAAAMAFAPGPNWIYALRFLLGVAEAGFFPGVILYLTQWFPNKQRTKAIATLMMSIPIASVLGGPVNGFILDTFDGVLGIDGWRWLFLLGGLPAILIGGIFYLVVVDSPDKAKWLTPAERTSLMRTLAAEELERSAGAPQGHGAMFKDKRVLGLALVYFLILSGAYPLTYWLPTIVADVGGAMSGLHLGLLSAIPFAFAALAMYIVGRRIRSEGSPVPVVVTLVVAGLAFIVTAVSLDLPLIAMVTVTVATMAAQTAKPLFWSLPTAYLSGAAAASGIALINSLGNAAGFASPYAFGWIKDATDGNNAAPMLVMIAASLLAIVIIAALYWRPRRTKLHHTTKASECTPA